MVAFQIHYPSFDFIQTVQHATVRNMCKGFFLQIPQNQCLGFRQPAWHYRRHPGPLDRSLRLHAPRVHCLLLSALVNTCPEHLQEDKQELKDMECVFIFFQVVNKTKL